MKSSIYICHHKASHMLEADGFIPLHVGKAASFNDIGCLGDNTGDNISSRNPFYCELTGHYWIWKNDIESDIIGLMHYRRHLSFSHNQSYEEDQWGCIHDTQKAASYHQKYGLTKTQLLAYMGDADAILPKQWDVRLAGSKNNYDHYKSSANLKISDYQKALDIVIDKHPEFSQAVKTYNDSHHGYYTNMFVMKREVFDAYSKWLFSILFELEKSINLSGYDQQQRRVFGHISERLFGIYFTYMKINKKLIINHAQRIFSDEGNFNGSIKPAFNNNNTSIVICFDNNYAHSGGALINSIIKHSSISTNYDILILEDDVSDKNKSHLKEMVAYLPNFSLRFFDVTSFTEIRGAHTRAHFSSATYARLFIPKIFEQQEKALFIDADTIVTHDISELFNINLGSNLVAAVKDIVMEAYVRTNMLTDEKTGFLPAQKYLNEYLGIANSDGYFQAGLIIFNLHQMRKEYTFNKLMDTLLLKPYWFLDQDIMNYVFQDRILYLPLNWNVFHGNGDSETLFTKLKFSTYIQYLDARRMPCMIHFAGGKKPWNDPSVDFADIYWAALRGTPWYEQAYALVHKKILRTKSNIKRPSIEARFRDAMKNLLGGLFPLGTARHQHIARFYLRLLAVVRRSRSSG